MGGRDDLEKGGENGRGVIGLPTRNIFSAAGKRQSYRAFHGGRASNQ